MAVLFKACSVGDCNRNAHGNAKGRKGFCRSHYERLIKHGDPLGESKRGKTLRFIHEVALQHDGKDCLTWPFAKDSDGRGSIKVGGRSVIASRYVCTLAHGEPPTPKHEASHSCGKGHLACVSKSHLSWKTAVQNNADKLIHGTHSRGERHGQARLTEQQVQEIRGLKGSMAQQKIAHEYGVSEGAISAIYRRISWAWLD